MKIMYVDKRNRNGNRTPCSLLPSRWKLQWAPPLSCHLVSSPNEAFLLHSSKNWSIEFEIPPILKNILIPTSSKFASTPLYSRILHRYLLQKSFHQSPKTALPSRENPYIKEEVSSTLYDVSLFHHTFDTSLSLEVLEGFVCVPPMKNSLMSFSEKTFRGYLETAPKIQFLCQSCYWQVNDSFIW